MNPIVREYYCLYPNDEMPMMKVWGLGESCKAVWYQPWWMVFCFMQVVASGKRFLAGYLMGNGFSCSAASCSPHFVWGATTY